MTEKIISVERMESLIDVFGSFDENLRVIESEFGVKVFDRDATLRVVGEAEDVQAAVDAIEGLMNMAARGGVITSAETRYIAGLAKSGDSDKITDFINGGAICVTAKGKPVKAKTLGQKKYIETIQRETVT
ncbi:MAG: PhoH family protein, partial [Oscillospiraceae bacterium]|nr:PhoH family protein [Oscillospiraceae bacterium]